MSDDLIERLRAMDATSQPNLLTVRESADHIEAQAAEIERLREALEEMLHAYCSATGFHAAVTLDTGNPYPWEPGDRAQRKARAALENKP